MLSKSISLLVCLSAACLAQGPSNQYLPPDKGYSYPPPNVPFPSGPGPSVVSRPPPGPPSGPPPSQPPTSYNPPGSTPVGPPAPPKPPAGPGGPYPPAGPPAGAPGPGAPVGSYGPDSHLNMPHVPGMPFEFDYSVNDPVHMAYYSHNAASDGDQVKGEYKVQLPDGRTQIVSYVADWATGFHADVKYEGEATYPAPSVAGAPYPGSGGSPSGPAPGSFPSAPGTGSGGYPSAPGPSSPGDFQGYPAAGAPEGVTGGGY